MTTLINQLRQTIKELKLKLKYKDEYIARLIENSDKDRQKIMQLETEIREFEWAKRKDNMEIAKCITVTVDKMVDLVLGKTNYSKAVPTQRGGFLDEKRR